MKITIEIDDIVDEGTLMRLLEEALDGAIRYSSKESLGMGITCQELTELAVNVKPNDSIVARLKFWEEERLILHRASMTLHMVLEQIKREARISMRMKSIRKNKATQ